MQLGTATLQREAAVPALKTGPELTVIAPSFNEAENVAPLIEKLSAALDGVHWEVIFVDDDSPDGTSDRVREQARHDARVRCVQRLGRRGLTSACAEAVLASSAPYVAIIDADLQHDETLLPQMLAVLKEGVAEIVIGSRYTERKLSEGFSRARQTMSFIATRLAQSILGAKLTDPVSGFFMAKRDVFEGAIRNLSGIGNKILVDIFASSNRRLEFRELPYQFRARLHGESKLDTLTVWEYLVLLADKLFGRFIPVRLILFSLVGASGVLVNFAVFWAARHALLVGAAGSYAPDAEVRFKVAAALATLVAATSNFFLNNVLTYRDKRLRGWAVVSGLISFLAICSVGAVVSVSFAAQVRSWFPAGMQEGRYVLSLALLSGIAVSTILNFSASAIFTWRRK
ncbi:MAG: glycosyltransferase family 2 protein [Rhodomicrobium sp.]